MDISNLDAGNKDKLNVFLQSSKGSSDLYEYDEKSETLILKKSLNIKFPANYGFIPKTHHIDGKPLDVLVLTDRSLQEGTVLKVRPIGLIRLKGQVPDDILVAVSLEDKNYERVKDINQVDGAVVAGLKEFLEEFKNMEVQDTFDSEHAKRSVEHAIELYKREFE